MVEESPVVKEKFSPIGQRSTAVLIKYPWSADPKSTKSLINRFVGEWELLELESLIKESICGIAT